MTNRIVTSLRVLCAILCAIQRASAQGPLTPPGPPAPTMLTLSQVEPRTPISALPATISTSGSYYITTNLTGIAGGTNGITILASDVTLDLSGFTLHGVAGSGAGIYVPNSEKNLAIRNGVLESWVLAGVNAANGYNSQFERLRVSNSGGTGLATGSNCVVLVCSMSANGSDGIDLGNNSTVKDCTANGNSDNGIIAGNGCTVKDCTASGNNGTDGAGIQVQNYCSVIDCTASGNNGTAGNGIFVGDYCTVIDCTASGNNGTAGTGIQVGLGNYVIDCTASGNNGGPGTYGIWMNGGQNRIDGNSVADNSGYGIVPQSVNAANRITRNSAVGNSTNYFNYAGNNDYAPTGAVHTATNPWTNFQ